jgi:hypothetical protein
VLDILFLRAKGSIRIHLAVLDPDPDPGALEIDQNLQINLASWLLKMLFHFL